MANERSRPTLVETGDGSLTLYSPTYEQTFHSHHGAVTEARWVFLEASGVGARLRRGAPTSVLEVGFGSALNFLLTLDAAVSHGAALSYHALEREPLPPATFAAVEHAKHLARPDLTEHVAALLAAAVPLGRTPGGVPTLIRDLEACGGSLHLTIGDATEAPLPSEGYHAVYHDAFSPQANEELWSESFLARLHRCLRPGGTLVTYTVAGAVRRRLQSLGIDVAKRPGPPGGKREMLVATRAAS